MYATPTAIREAVAVVRNIKQMSVKDYLNFSYRLNKAVHRSVNVFQEHDKMLYLVDGLRL